MKSSLIKLKKDMNEIYWLTRLDRIIDLFTCIVSISLAIAIISIFVWVITIGEIKKEYSKLIVKIGICAISLFLVFRIISVFIPTTNEALAIYGIGGTIDYIKDNDKAKQLPDKVIDALDKYLDSINKKEKEE